MKSAHYSHSSAGRTTAIFLLSLLACSGSLTQMSLAQSQEMLARELLVDMARSQFSVLCQSQEFASCMGFTTQACLNLSENAIKQCLLPLPEQINPAQLDNAALEACPKEIYANAGFSEEKAGHVF